MQQILIGCNKSLLEARGTFWPFWAHAAIIRSCQQLPQAQATAAPRAENPFSGPTRMFFLTVPRRPRRSRPSCSPSRRCAAINHSSEKTILAIRSAGPVPGFTEAHPLPRRALPPKPRLLLARHHQRANKASVGTVSTYSTHLRTSVHPIRASLTVEYSQYVSHKPYRPPALAASACVRARLYIGSISARVSP